MADPGVRPPDIKYGTGHAIGASANGWDHAEQAHIYPVRDLGHVECHPSIELVVFRFASFGRLGHLRRWLQAVPQVTSVRITGYVNKTALLSLDVSPGTASRSLVPPGTRLINSDGRRIELCVDTG